jgi:ATP-dependent Clp protease ATP-binding subunit ClpA
VGRLFIAGLNYNGSRQVGMFESYSTRALRVIFIARFTAGRRGGPFIDVEDLLSALILEDQGEIGKALSELRNLHDGSPAGYPRKEHHSFLAPEQAADILQQIQAALPQSDPLPTSTDMRVSPELSQILAAAADIPKRFHKTQLEPLHLLLAIAEGSTESVTILRDAGITTDKIAQALEAGHGE